MPYTVCDKEMGGELFCFFSPGTDTSQTSKSLRWAQRMHIFLEENQLRDLLTVVLLHPSLIHQIQSKWNTDYFQKLQANMAGG